MKIVVCVKQVPEITDVKVNPETGTLIQGRNYVYSQPILRICAGSRAEPEI